MALAAREPLLQMVGPLTVKEAEALIFHAARQDDRFEAAQRTWLEEDRSYFVRHRDTGSRTLRVVGLVHAYQLPEMASRLEVIPFDPDDAASTGALAGYVALLRAELEREGFV